MMHRKKLTKQTITALVVGLMLMLIGVGSPDAWADYYFGEVPIGMWGGD